MSRRKIEDVRDQVDRLIPLLLAQSWQVVTQNGVVDATIVTRVLLATPQFRDKGRQTEIVVGAIVAEYVDALNGATARRRTRRPWRLWLPKIRPK